MESGVMHGDGGGAPARLLLSDSTSVRTVLLYAVVVAALFAAAALWWSWRRAQRKEARRNFMHGLRARGETIIRKLGAFEYVLHNIVATNGLHNICVAAECEHMFDSASMREALRALQIRHEMLQDRKSVV